MLIVYIPTTGRTQQDLINLIGTVRRHENVTIAIGNQELNRIFVQELNKASFEKSDVADKELWLELKKEALGKKITFTFHDDNWVNGDLYDVLKEIGQYRKHFNHNTALMLTNISESWFPYDQWNFYNEGTTISKKPLPAVEKPVKQSVIKKVKDIEMSGVEIEKKPEIKPAPKFLSKITSKPVVTKAELNKPDPQKPEVQKPESKTVVMTTPKRMLTPAPPKLKTSAPKPVLMETQKPKMDATKPKVPAFKVPKLKK